MVRAGDFARPEIVAPGEVVRIVYEAPGLVLTMRGHRVRVRRPGRHHLCGQPAIQEDPAGADRGAGNVSVSAPLPGRLAINVSTDQRQ